MAGINTKLDADQVIKQAYDEPNQRLRVDAQVSATISDVRIEDSDGDELKVNPDGSLNVNIAGGALQVEIDAADGDNIAISDGTNTVVVNPDGSLNVALSGLSAVQINDGTDTLAINADGSLNTIVQGKTLSLTGTANANNINIVGPVEVSEYDTIIIHNTGTFNLTSQAQFSNDNVNWVAVLGQTLSAAGTAPTTSLNTTNTIYKVPVSGRYFRYRTTAYTSGTITGNVLITVHDINDFGSRNNTISGTVTTSGTITAGNVQVTGTGAAVNATPIASTVVGQYDAATLALTGTWNATLLAEGSNDGTNWFNIPVQRIDSLSSLPQTGITTNGLYKIPLQYNNLRVRISAYTSGTVNANARISAIDSENLAPKQIVESGTLSNTYNEVINVASGVLTTIASFTATQNTRLKQVDVSGENVAQYEVLVNGNIVSKKRTYFGSYLDTSFYFDKGINFTSGQIVLVRVLHNRPTVGNFNANILVIEG